MVRIAGAYPAVFLSSFQPVQAIKGTGFGSRRSWLRNGLVVTQFSISISLLIGTLVVRDQLAFVQSKSLGFDREHVLVVRNSRVLGERRHVFRERVASLPGVAGASIASSLPGGYFDSMIFKPEQPSNYEETSLPYTMVDEHFLNVLGIDIVEGRAFQPAAFPADTTAVLINQSAASTLGS